MKTSFPPACIVSHNNFFNKVMHQSLDAKSGFLENLDFGARFKLMNCEMEY